MDIPMTNDQAPTTIRAAIYVRTATADQGERDLAIEAQLHRCREAAQSAGYEVIAECQDRGMSGVTLDRPGLKALWDAIRREDISVVIVAAIDRLARSAAGLLSIREELKCAGVEVHIASCGNEIDPHQAGILDQLTAMVAGDERRRIVERMAVGKRRKQELGVPSPSHPPFGYRYTGQGEHRRLMVDQTQAALVQQIVTWVTGSDGTAPLTLDQVMERLKNIPDVR